MNRKLVFLIIFALVVMVTPVKADSLSGLADVTVEDGAIISIRYADTEYVVADGDLVLGTTTRWYIPADTNEATLWAEGDPAPDATVSGTSSPKEGDVGSNADNLMFAIEGDPDNISSIDGIDFQETIFPELSDTFFIFERGGNDTGTMQAILEDGTLGAEVAFDKASNGGPYADTGVSNGNQNAYGVVFMTDVPVMGVRITASGHDTLSISIPAPDPTPMDPNPADGAIRVSPEPLLNIYASDDVPLSIPDRWMTTTTVSSSLNIPDSFTITDLNVELDISHSKNNADLNVYLVGPDGTQVELFTDVGVWEKGFKNTVLSDEAGTSIKNGSGSFTGTFKPEGKLSAFDGKNAQGTWKLEVSDDWNSGTGTVNSWKLVIESPNILSWIPGKGIASQDVYIAKNFDDVNDSAEAAFQGNLAADVSEIEIILEEGQEYFWRVDSVDADGMLIEMGAIWSFWTTPDPIFVNPDSDLAAATAPAKPGGVVEFAPGTYNLTSQIIVNDHVTYLGAGPDSTILDGGGATRAFAAWGDRGATDGQVDAEGAGVTNMTGPTGWVIDGMTIQNCASAENNRQDILSAARDLLNNYVADTPYTLETASAENGGVTDNPEWFDILSGAADDDLTDVELQEYLDANPVGSEGHLVVNGDMHTKGGAIIMLNGAKGAIQNCTILNSSSVNDGGAIHARLSPLNAAGDPGITLENITIDGCTAGDDGGGLGIDGPGNDADSVPVVVINDVTITNCRAGGPAPDDGNRDGGGIHLNHFLDVTITNTLIDSCTAGRHGAGIMIDNRVFDGLIDSCLVSNCSNDVIDGEGGDGVALSIDTDASIVTISNCIFSNNVNNQDDGIVRVDAHEGMIINCTFVGNISSDQGIVRYATGEDDASVQNGVVNCLFVNNDVSPGSDQVIAHNKGGVTYTYTNNAFFGNILDEGDSHIDSIDDADLDLFDNLLLTVDPLVDAAGGDYHIVEGSFVIDASDPDNATAVDIVGMPAYGIRDIGAFESEFDPPPTIAWVSYHAADDEPHADAAAVGFTQAPDIEYTDLLKAQGYKVVRVVTSQSPDVEFLNTMDLVIISRTASSGHYSGSGASLWNSVTAPTINLNGYTLRSSRMGFTDGTTMVDTTGDIRLAVTDPNHPIFAGIALTDGVMDNLYAEGAVPLPTDETIISRGISINDNVIDEEGTLLATIAEASADAGPVGGMVIAEYPAGATMQNSSGSADDVLGGPRLVFLTGSREPSGVTGGQAAALYDLYEDGTQMFVNAVEYMLSL